VGTILSNPAKDRSHSNASRDAAEDRSEASSNDDAETGSRGIATKQQESISLWRGLLGTSIAATLSKLPPGVDPEDADVQKIVHRLKMANPQVAGTRGILQAK